MGENLKSKFTTEAVLVKTVIYQMLGVFKMLNRAVIHLRMGGRTAGQGFFMSGERKKREGREVCRDQG